MSDNGPPILQRPEGVDLRLLQQIAEAKKEAVRQHLEQHGLQCKCGERIRDQGVLLFTMNENAIQMTPQGPVPVMNWNAAAYCSAQCKIFREARCDPHAMAVRDLTAVTWLDEMEEEPCAPGA